MHNANSLKQQTASPKIEHAQSYLRLKSDNR